MVDFIIFDVDGTLVDSVDLHAEAWQQALGHFDVEVALERVRSQIGKGGDQLLPALVPAEQLKRIREPLEKYRGDLFRRDYLPRVKPFPQVRELFETLRADGKRLALASSAKEKELQDYKRIAGIVGLTDAESHSGEVQNSKPHPEVMEIIRGKLGSPPPERCVMVGDSPYDAEAAGKAGIPSVAMLCGGFPRQALEQAGYSAFFRDPAELLAFYRADPAGTFSGKTAGRPERKGPARS